MELGARIRMLRRTQGRTLQEIAERCGFTRSLLSKIETGRTAPPVATLARIAAALGTSVSGLIDGAEESGTVFIRASEIEKTVETTKGYRFHAFAAGRAGKLMQPFLFTAARGKVRGGTLAHPGEEFVCVLEGRMKYRVGAVEYRLGPGDSLYFNAQEPHDLEPISAEVRYLAVFAEPAGARGSRRTKGDRKHG